MADVPAKTPAPIKTWRYPFQGKGDPKAANPKALEVTDPKTYFTALATAAGGFYPIGANGQWHGGIHFDSLTAGTLAQDTGVRCIADGEVIAYRIDSTYAEVKYDCGQATYSKGFVLIKHRLQLPPAPKQAATNGAAGSPAPSVPPSVGDSAAGVPPFDSSSAPPADAANGAGARASADNEPSLTFFSLYMHLLDWAGFEAEKTRARPAFWIDSTKFVVDKQAVDKDPYTQPTPEGKGINVRQGNSSSTPRIGWLPPGTKLMVEAGTGPWRKIASLDSGQMSADGSHVAATDALLGWVYIKELDQAAGEPKAKDTVHVLDIPTQIKAGELIGYLGQYQRYADTSALAWKDRPLVHVEVFSGDDVKGFIAKSKARGQALDAKQKTLLVIDKGTKLVLPTASDHTVAAGADVKATDDSPKTGSWAKVEILTSKPAPTQNDPKAVEPTPAGGAFWVERRMLNDTGQRTSTFIELDAWKQFPLQAANTNAPQASYPRVAAIHSLETTATDDQGVRWWKIDVDTPDATGNTLGWACETGQLHSPWEWPGFEIVDEDAIPPVDLHGKQLIDQKLDTPADHDDFKAKAERAKEGALFQKLYDVIDTDKNETLSTDELRAALKKPWLAQTISRLITRYESEWGGDMGKWDELDPHMGEQLNDWTKEKGRIEELQWWNQLKGKHGFPDSPAAFHFHPVGLVANFGAPPLDAITYRIHHKEGLIERIKPRRISSNKENIIRYIYFDSNEIEHDLGEYTFFETSQRSSGNIVVAGMVKLTDLRNLRNYSNGTIKYGFEYDTRMPTLRSYMKDTPLASLLGAMLEVGYEDISCNGFSNANAESVGGSKSHINGTNGDMKFLRKDGQTQEETSLHIDAQPELMDEVRQNAFNDALYKFGWKSMLAWRYTLDGESKLLNHTSHFKDHNHHLHLQSYSPNLREIDE